MVLKEKSPEKFEFKVYVRFPLGDTIITFHSKDVYREFTWHYKNIKEFLSKTPAEKIAKWIKEGKLSIKDIYITQELNFKFGRNLSVSKIAENVENGIKPGIKNAKIVVLSKKKSIPTAKKTKEQKPTLTFEETVQLMTNKMLFELSKKLNKMGVPEETTKKTIKGLKKYIAASIIKSIENGQNMGITFNVYKTESGRYKVNGYIVEGGRVPRSKEIILKFVAEFTFGSGVSLVQPLEPGSAYMKTTPIRNYRHIGGGTFTYVNTGNETPDYTLLEL